MTTIEVRDLHKKFRDSVAVAGISFDVPDGAFLTLLGPSGCGKTTTLRMLAGLEKPDSGEIKINGELVAAPRKRVDVPTEKRNVGVVFQSYALWPHMTVFDQVAYPLRVRKKKDELRAKVSNALAMVGLDKSHFGRYPSELSGGQQQRVALARALVFDPAVLLLDEPLSNLDAELRTKVRAELGRIQRGTGVTTVYVTHDQSEALALSDEILLMRSGHIVEGGTPHQIYDTPRTAYTAQFVGAANCIPATVTGIDGDLAELKLTSGDSLAARADWLSATDVGSSVTVVIRSEDISVGPLAEHEHENVAVLRGVVSEAAYLGSHKQLVIRVGIHAFTVNASKQYRDMKGRDVAITVPHDGIRILPVDPDRLHTANPITAT